MVCSADASKKPVQTDAHPLLGAHAAKLQAQTTRCDYESSDPCTWEARAVTPLFRCPLCSPPITAVGPGGPQETGKKCCYTRKLLFNTQGHTFH